MWSVEAHSVLETAVFASAGGERGHAASVGVVAMHATRRLLQRPRHSSSPSGPALPRRMSWGILNCHRNLFLKEKQFINC